MAAALATPVCTVTDDRLAELSGLAVLVDDVWAMDDGGREIAVHRLDGCEIVDTRTADVDPYDAEDLATGPNGALWVGDIGDNERSRDTIAVVVLPARGPAVLHRLTYPDGPHDAEALLVSATGVPYVITKEAGRPAGVYRTAAPPSGTGPTPLEKVADLSLPASDTEGGPLGDLGSRTVTGAALSADGTVAALRTYTDAWLFAIPDGDLAAALAGVPVQVPLPEEPQGEALAFTADGALLSGSEARAGEPGELRAVSGAVALASGPPSTPPVAIPPVKVTPAWLPGLVGTGAAGGVLLLLGAALALRARRR